MQMTTLLAMNLMCVLATLLYSYVVRPEKFGGLWTFEQLAGKYKDMLDMMAALVKITQQLLL